MLTDGNLISEWRLIRFELFQALAELNVEEIHLIERVNNVLTICFVLSSDATKLKPLTQMRVLDGLIARKSPELYKSFVILYEVWNDTEWKRQLVAKVGQNRIRRGSFTY